MTEPTVNVPLTADEIELLQLAAENENKKYHKEVTRSTSANAAFYNSRIMRLATAVDKLNRALKESQ